MISFKIEAHFSSGWHANAVRLATREEAQRYGCDLFSRWTTPDAWRIVSVHEPVNYRFDEEGWLIPHPDALVTGAAAISFGPGGTPTITASVQKLDVLMQAAMQKMQQGHIDDAVLYLQEVAAISQSTRD
jgi:hypothetical protein